MAFEIERKYLVINTDFRQMAQSSCEMVQGYLSRTPERTVRIRRAGNKAFLTIKGLNHGLVRTEFEYSIPIEDFDAVLSMCIPPVIEKVRHFVPFDGKIWEVDEYQGNLAPLIVAEIELDSAEERFSIPSFIGKEVTGDPRYYNSVLGSLSANETPG